MLTQDKVTDLHFITIIKCYRYMKQRIETGKFFLIINLDCLYTNYTVINYG